MGTQVSVSSATRTRIAYRVGRQERLLALDALRAIALFSMALDHAAASVWISLQAETYGGQPALLESWPHWVAGLFTNLAAPTFWLLSGVSLALFEAARLARGAAPRDITRHLLIRSGLIIMLDLTVCWLAWNGKGPYLHVLLSIGLGLAIMTLARLLPTRVLGIFLAIAIPGYQVLLPLFAPLLSQTNHFWIALLITYSTTTVPATEFSLLGWMPLMGLGYLLGGQVRIGRLRQPLHWLAMGMGLLGLWLVLRLVGGFGDLTPFAPGQPWYYFLIMSKTPPSLSYLSFNLGISALLLAALLALQDWLEKPALRWLAVCGQVALFFFVLHLVAYGLIGKLITALALPLPGMVRAVGLWAVGLSFLVPLAIGYRRLKVRKPQSVLRYL